MRVVMSVLVAGGLLSSGCSDQSFNSINDAEAIGAEIEVSPARLDFGELGKGDVQTKTFTITSVGEADLNVTDIRLGQGVEPNFAIVADATDFFLPAGASTEIEVTFTPTSDAEQTDLVIVESNATLNPKATVDLSGFGAVPELEISPDPYDFGTLYIGCGADVDLTLTNVGSDTLVIDGVEMSGDYMTYIRNFTLPLTLEPGESEEVAVMFEPLEEDFYEGSITVTSNEPIVTRDGTQSGEGRFVNTSTENFEIPKDPPSDIMFVVDQSCSMDDDQTRLNNNFSYNISNLNTYTSDWQIIVGNNSGGCNNAGTVLTASTAGYENAFEQAVRSGTDRNVNDPEALLITAYNGVNNTDAGECNSGFLREDALLHVILVSDEPEQSGNWSSYTEGIINKKDPLDISKTKISAIAGDIPSGCGSAEPGTGYWEASGYTGGLFLSICETDWSAYMEDLAEASIIHDTFELSGDPWVDSITVYIDGVEVDPSAWEYDATTNSIVITDTSMVSEGGSIVTVDYGHTYDCD